MPVCGAEGPLAGWEHGEGTRRKLGTLDSLSNTVGRIRTCWLYAYAVARPLGKIALATGNKALTFSRFPHAATVCHAQSWRAGCLLPYGAARSGSRLLNNRQLHAPAASAHEKTANAMNRRKSGAWAVVGDKINRVAGSS